MLCVNIVKNELGYKSLFNPRRNQNIFVTFQHKYYFNSMFHLMHRHNDVRNRQIHGQL
jgi:hypothetical protein